MEWFLSNYRAKVKKVSTALYKKMQKLPFASVLPFEKTLFFIRYTRKLKVE